MNLRKTDELLEAASLAVNNSRNNPAVQQQLETFGMTSARLQTGANLLKDLRQKNLAQTKIQNERWALSQQINESLLATRDQFKEHARIAQVAFRQDPQLLNLLGIGQIARRRWDCVRQAIFFYERLQEKKLSLELLGVSRKELQETQAIATQLLDLKETRVQKKGLAEQGTHEKQQAQRALHEWMIEFRAIARIAFRQQPQMLEMFGIKVGVAA